MANSPAGWYDDPNDARLERFWDGEAWTNTAQPRAEFDFGAAAAATQAPTDSPAVDTSAVATPTTPTTASSAAAVAEVEPPAWAAEVVAVEAEKSEQPVPWWRRANFLTAAALIAVSAVALFFVIGNGDDSLETDAEAPGRAVFAGADTEAVDDDTDPAVTTSVLAADEAEDDSTTTTAADPALAAVDTTEDDAEEADGTDSTTSIPEAETATGAGSTTEAPDATAETQAPADDATESTTTTTTTTTSPTTTAAPTVVVNDVSAGCLEAMQAAVDAGDPPPEAIHPTFEQCSDKAEWDAAAEATGLAQQIDTETWVANECIYSADLYTSPLCESAISPDSGPRRISCDDGRADIEWPFVDDEQTNDEVCANHFQIECPAGVFHNIPVEAMSEEDANAALCGV